MAGDCGERPAIQVAGRSQKSAACLVLLEAVKTHPCAENLRALLAVLGADRYSAILCRHHGGLQAIVEAWKQCPADVAVASASSSSLALYVSVHAVTLRKLGVEALCSESLLAAGACRDRAPVAELWRRLGGPCPQDTLSLLRRGDSDPAVLRPLLRGLAAKNDSVVSKAFGDGEAYGALTSLLSSELAQQAMALLCKIADPIEVPHCTRGRAGESSEDSDSEASDVEDDVAELPRTRLAQVKPSTADTSLLLSPDEAAEKRRAGIEDFLAMTGAEACAEDDVDSRGEDCCTSPAPQLDEFRRHLALSTHTAADWPVLFPGPGGDGFSFHADFEGGNLRRARLEDDGSIEILLCGDTNRGNTSQWFFFDVESEAERDLRLHIVRFGKESSTFAQGQKAVTLSPGTSCWRRDGWDYAYMPNRYTISGRRRLYTLAFTLRLQPGRTRIAHFYPYLFGDVLADIRRLQPVADILEVRKLGLTPQGRPMLMLKIADFVSSTETSACQHRPHIVISARVHPGEVPASFMMRGVLQLLLSTDAEAQSLRKKFTFIVMPMLNPDGVAAGNSRANSEGYDLNRCWEKPPKGSEIELAKIVVQDACATSGGVVAFLDLHAHSKRNGVFTFSNPGGEDLPDILRDLARDLFARRQCTFHCESSRRGSARSTVWREFGVMHAHTVESTYAATPDLSRLVTPEDLAEMGKLLVRGCMQLQERDTAVAQPHNQKATATRKKPKKATGPEFTLVM